MTSGVFSMLSKFEKLLEDIRETSPEKIIGNSLIMNRRKAQEIADDFRSIGLPNEIINVAIEYTILRKEYLNVDGVKAVLHFLKKKGATDAESAINVIREANLKRK